MNYTKSPTRSEHNFQAAAVLLYLYVIDEEGGRNSHVLCGDLVEAMGQLGGQILISTTQ